MIVLEILAKQILNESAYNAGACNRMAKDEEPWSRLYRGQDVEDLVNALMKLDTRVQIFDSFEEKLLINSYLEDIDRVIREPFYKMFGRGGEAGEIDAFLERHPEWKVISDIINRPY